MFNISSINEAMLPVFMTALWFILTPVLLMANAMDYVYPKRDTLVAAYDLFNLLVLHPIDLVIGYGGYFYGPYIFGFTYDVRLSEDSLPIPALVVALCMYQASRQISSCVMEMLGKTPSFLLVLHHLAFIAAVTMTPFLYSAGGIDYKDVFFFGGIMETSTIFYTFRELLKALYPKPCPAHIEPWVRYSGYIFFVFFAFYRVIWWTAQSLHLLILGYTRLGIFNPRWMALFGILTPLTLLQFYWAGLMIRILIRSKSVPMNKKILIDDGINEVTEAVNETKKSHND